FHANLSVAIASFHLAASLSRETPIMLSPLACSSLYIATTLGFSTLHGLHHDAQKSITVTLPIDSFSDIALPSGLGAENAGAVLPTSALVLPACAPSVVTGSPAFTIMSPNSFPSLVFLTSSAKLSYS